MAKRVQRMRKRRAEMMDALVNLTPLIDVVFSILIVFILVAPMLNVDSILLATKGEKKETLLSDKGSKICIYVKEDDTVWLERSKVTLSELVDLLKKEKEKHPIAAPQVFHDRRATFGTYQSIKNALESAGFEQMDIILQPT